MGNPVCMHGVSIEAYCTNCNCSFGPFRRLIQEDAFDAEIARLRTERDAARAQLACRADTRDCVMDEQPEIPCNEKNCRYVHMVANLAAARETLAWFENRLRDAINTCYGGCTHEEIDAALSRLSSPGAQQRAGEDG